MPYWCENTLTITGPDVHRILDAIRTKNCSEEDARVIDFNRLIPYPQHFRDLDQRSHEYKQKFNAIGKKDPKRKNKLKRIADQFGVQPGTTCLKNGYESGGYEWVCKNWATQSNAVDDRLTTCRDTSQNVVPQTLTCSYCKAVQQTENLTVLACQQCGNLLPDPHPLQALIEFGTAWTPPLPVIDKLAAMFPDHQFEMSYYEGGIGFCGHARWSGGVKNFHEMDEYDGPRGG